MLQKSGMSEIVKQQKVNTNRAILLNLKQKLLSQVFVIILMQLEFLVLWLWLLWLITGNVTVNADNNTDPAFKNCAPFSTCKTVINDVFADEADHIYIAMPMYNFIECSNNSKS